ARSDFALLGNDRDAHEPEVYPINASLRTFGPALYEQATRDMVALDEARFFGRHVTLFMKPSIACEGDSGGWMTRGGLEWQCLCVGVTGRPVVGFNGQGNFVWLGGTPTVTARLTQEGTGMELPMPCTVELGPSPASAAATRPYAIACSAQRVTIDPAKP